MHVLATKLKARARELNLTDAEVARRAGLTERRYGHYVTGARRPGYETLLRLCSVLRTSPNYLLGYEEGSEADPMRLLKDRADSAWNVLDPVGRELAVELLDALVKHRLLRRNTIITEDS